MDSNLRNEIEEIIWSYGFYPETPIPQKNTHKYSLVDLTSPPSSFDKAHSAKQYGTLWFKHLDLDIREDKKWLLEVFDKNSAEKIKKMSEELMIKYPIIIQVVETEIKNSLTHKNFDDFYVECINPLMQ